MKKLFTLISAAFVAMAASAQVHNHSFNSEEWQSNETNHWHPCNNVEGYCDLESAEDYGSLMYADAIASAYGKHVYGTDATSEAYYTCATCAYEDAVRKEDYLVATSHQHVYSPLWSCDETQHWHVCVGTIAPEDCDAPTTEPEDHAFGEVITKPTYAYCTVCGYYDEARYQEYLTTCKTIFIEAKQDAYDSVDEYLVPCYGKLGQEAAAETKASLEALGYDELLPLEANIAKIDAIMTAYKLSLEAISETRKAYLSNLNAVINVSNYLLENHLIITPDDVKAEVEEATAVAENPDCTIEDILLATNDLNRALNPHYALLQDDLKALVEAVKKFIDTAYPEPLEAALVEAENVLNNSEATCVDYAVAIYNLQAAYDTAVAGINNATVATEKNGKFIQNGRVVIMHNGKIYNANGQLVK